MWRSIGELLSRIRAALFDEGGVEEIFRHARNIVPSTLIMAAGIHAVDHPLDMKSLGVFDFRIAGYSAVILGILLFALNFVDGLYRLSKLKQGLFLQLIVVAIYLVVTVRIAQLIVALRTT